MQAYLQKERMQPSWKATEADTQGSRYKQRGKEQRANAEPASYERTENARSATIATAQRLYYIMQLP